MMENRSFDHALGYLSLDGPDRMPVEGLRSAAAWQDGWTNSAQGMPYPLHELGPADAIDDPPHGKKDIETQISTPAKGQGELGGFVQAYVDSRRRVHAPVATPGAPMGYYAASSVPTFDFFARNYCVCDHWFSALPLGTQANRLMAMSGESRLVDNETGVPDQPLVYDWLKRNAVKWRVYQAGGYFPFFTMMDSWAYRILGSLVFGGEFRRLSKFGDEWRNNNKAMASVVFIEPEYTDGPHSQPNDDHPPTPIARGQLFLREVYETLISNPARWGGTLLIVTYDEHGGFFDHVPPIAIPASAGTPPDTATFGTSGLRVPAFLISPFVQPGSVYSADLDHTSFLAFLAERFTSGHGYSVAVNARQGHLAGRISAALSTAPRTEAPPSMAGSAGTVTGAAAAAGGPPRAPDTTNAVAFDQIARRLKKERPDIYGDEDMAKVRDYLLQASPPVPAAEGHIPARGP
jgi:phospholipase C